jgi:hypothetical protein
MDAHVALTAAGLFVAGLLAGEELVVCYGVRGAIGVLDDRSHVELRQALIRRLRVLVPGLFGPAAMLAVAVAILDRGRAGGAWRLAAVVGLAVWFGVTAFGTVPINAAAIDWDPGAPPAGWRSLVARWERLDVARCWASIVAFGCLVAATAALLTA